MIGVVLCGGSSTRMGSDKGLLLEGGQTWAQIAIQKLAALHLPVVLSVNKVQLPAYLSIHKQTMIVDDAALAARGPLLGLLSVHLKFPLDDIFILACDMKNMNNMLLQNLRTTFLQLGDEATVYLTEGFPQPLCGIYSKKGLERIHTLLRAAELEKFSMKHVLEVLNTKYIPVKEEDIAYFNNYNSPEDL